MQGDGEINPSTEGAATSIRRIKKEKICIISFCSRIEFGIFDDVETILVIQQEIETVSFPLFHFYNSE
jgi:hypothetical protein